jgi:hypothetical protein
VNRAIAEGVCEGFVHEPVLVEEREPVEARARHGDLEVIAAAGPVLDAKLAGIGKGGAKQPVQAIDGQDAPC